MLHLSLALAHSPQPKTSLKIPSSSLSLQKLKTLKRHARDDDDGKLVAYAREQKAFFFSKPNDSIGAIKKISIIENNIETVYFLQSPEFF